MSDGYLKHSTLRGAERYGLQIDAQEYATLSAKIGFQEVSPSPDCVRLCPAAAGREKWAVWHKAEWVALIFDPKQARIVTLLPPRDLRRWRKELPW